MSSEIENDVDVMRDVYMSREQRAAYERILAKAQPQERAGSDAGACDLEELRELADIDFEPQCCNSGFPINMHRRVVRAAIDEITQLRAATRPQPASDAEWLELANQLSEQDRAIAAGLIAFAKQMRGEYVSYAEIGQIEMAKDALASDGAQS